MPQPNDPGEGVLSPKIGGDPVVTPASLFCHRNQPILPRFEIRLSSGASGIRTLRPTSRSAPFPRRAAAIPSRSAGESFRRGDQKLEFASTAGNFYDGRMRQITNSWATPRTSTSKSRPCTGGRAKCQAKPPDMAPRRTNSSARSGWMSKIV
jgi:hypothetical protein